MQHEAHQHAIRQRPEQRCRQRRADAVKRALTLLGVPERQIETVSFGSEKPKAQGSSEEAWAENRRSDLVYVGIDG